MTTPILRGPRARVAAGAVLAILSGCTGGETNLGDANVRAFATAYTAAWNSQDPARMAAHFSADGSLTINGGTPAVGRDAIGQAAAGYMAAFPDMHLTMDSLQVYGNRAVYHWTFEGTNTGPGGTGRPVRFSGFEEWTLTPDGLIRQSLGHYDQADYERQLRADTSLVPAPVLEPPPPDA
ncbi:MAG: SgcJ/EcaC family oxidoreductase [Gemmatimonadales bacterium]|nr:SgcJ/EcaC family oxidoreductase [Gemmatimonadales bacterium]